MTNTRDQWIGLCEDIEKHIRKAEHEEACSNLLKAVCSYADPEYNAHLDLTLANFLHYIDERSSVQLRRELQKLDLSENNLPEWAFKYFGIIIWGPPQSKDSRRVAKFRALSLAHPLCLETRFLLAGALNQTACDNEGGEQLFKEAISIIKSIKKTVSVNPERAAWWRTHSLFDKYPTDLLCLHHKWVLKNYIYQLQLEGRIEDAIKLLNKEEINGDHELCTIENLLGLEQRFERKIEEVAKEAQEKLREAQEVALGRHIKILGVFAIIIAVFILCSKRML